MEAADKAGTITGDVTLLAEKTKYLKVTGTTTLKVLGKLTGGLTVINNFYKSYNEWHQNKALSIFHAVEGLGQAAFMFAGAEEVELLYNSSTMVIDYFMPDNKKEK